MPLTSFLCLGALLLASSVSAQPPPWFGTQHHGPVTSGLVALYTFDEGKGATVRDRCSTAGSWNLVIADPKSITWRKGGGLLFRGKKGAVWTPKPATELVKLLKKTGQFTFEIVSTNADSHQTGPARILSLSKDSGTRNFTVGQSAHQFALRLRTSKSDTQGMPELNTGTKTALPMRQHLVATFGGGVFRFYVNGRLHLNGERPGDLSNWDAGYRLILGNEGSLDRPWNGAIERVAIYQRALSPAEVARNHEALWDTQTEKDG